MTLRRPRAAAAAVLAGLLAGGCHKAEAPRANVAGAVTFDGKPVLAGRVYLDPDPTANPSGSQGVADIHEGLFDTAAAGGRGPSPGPVIARVEGLTGPADASPPPRLLFRDFQVKFDVPAGGTTRDIAVPPSARVTAPPPTTLGP